MGLEGNVGVEGGEAPRRRLYLEATDAVDVVQDLPLQIGGVDAVPVDDSKGSNPCRGEVQRGRGAEPTGADKEHSGFEQLLLARLAYALEDEVAAVASLLFDGQSVAFAPGLPGLLPSVEAALKRSHVGVAELLHHGSGEDRPVAGRAVDDDGGFAVGHLLGHGVFENAARDGDGTFDDAEEVFVGFPYVDQRRAVGAGGELRDRHLGYIPQCRSDEVLIGACHARRLVLPRGSESRVGHATRGSAA